MPIRPENKKRYPINWKDISLQTIDLEEFKKVADQIIYSEELVFPEKFTIAKIDEKIYQFESKLNKRAKKWQSPYKFHK